MNNDLIAAYLRMRPAYVKVGGFNADIAADCVHRLYFCIEQGSMIGESFGMTTTFCVAPILLS